MNQFKDWATSLSKAVRVHLSLIVGLVVVVGLLIVCYNFLQELQAALTTGSLAPSTGVPRRQGLTLHAAHPA